MSKTCYDIQTWFVQFTYQKKTRKSYSELKLTLLNISIMKTSNINTGHKSMMVSNKRHNLQSRPEKSLNRYNNNTKRSQIWIKILGISEIKDLIHTIYGWTNWNVEMLDRWNWTFHMALLKALKYTPCLSFWACQKTIVEFTDSTHIIYWPAIIA